MKIFANRIIKETNNVVQTIIYVSMILVLVFFRKNLNLFRIKFTFSHFLTFA